MKLYVLKSLSALFNLLLISLVVRLFPSELAGGYMLMIGYVALSNLGLGLGIDTSIERYSRRLLGRWKKFHLLAAVVGTSGLRTLLLFLVVIAANTVRPGILEVSAAIYALAFFTFLLNTQASMLDGVFQYTYSAIANIIRAALRFLILAIPAAFLSLNAMLVVESLAAGAAAVFGAVVFHRTKVEPPAKEVDFGAIGKFMGWNYLTRFCLGFLSLNLVKVLVLRSNHPNAVLFAYAIQLTESVERFLPSVVLAGRYRPELSKIFDDANFARLRTRFRALAGYSIGFAAAIAVAHLVALPAAFVILQGEQIGPYWGFFGICAFWLFVANAKYSLNIVSNVIEENHIQFFVSAILSVAFIAAYAMLRPLLPAQILLLMLVILGFYPVLWFIAARKAVRSLRLEPEQPGPNL